MTTKKLPPTICILNSTLRDATTTYSCRCMPFMAGAKGQSMIGALCTVRHKGIDVLLTHQSIAKITTSEWQNCTWLRLHHQVDEIIKYRERIPKYAMVRIAQLIVDEQYDLASKAYADGRLSTSQYAVQKSFFLYINMRQQKIIGCSRAAFIRSAKRYIDQEESRKVRMYLNERDFNGNPIYKNQYDHPLLVPISKKAYI